MNFIRSDIIECSITTVQGRIILFTFKVNTGENVQLKQDFNAMIKLMNIDNILQ